MIPVSRHQHRPTDAADLSAAQHASVGQHASSVSNLTAKENNTPTNESPTPGLPRTLQVGGEEYYSGALKGRFNSDQKAYLVSAGTPDENKPVTQHPDGSKEYSFSHNEDNNCTARLHADEDNCVTSLTIKDGRGQEVVNAQFDKNYSVSGVPDRLNFNEPNVNIPPGAISDGSQPPYHPDGERYQVMGFMAPGSKNPLMVTGLRHSGGNSFTVYDTTNHKPVTQLTVVASTAKDGTDKELLFTSEQLRLHGGMRHFLPKAAGVKTSSSSPTGFKRESDNLPCDRHGNLVPAAGSSQAASSASAAQPVATTVEDIIARGADPADHTEPTGFRSMDHLREYVSNHPVPQMVFRAHDGDDDEIATSGLERNILSDRKEGDDYLADIIRHTAATGGSAGNVLSFSSNLAIANRFLHAGRTMTKVDTHQLPGSFKSAAQILLEDGDRLLASGKVNASLMRKALENVLTEGEQEVFCLAGDVPASAVSVVR